MGPLPIHQRHRLPGAVVAVVAASQKKNVAALRAKVAAARSEK
jgi:hypothetical protein